MSYPSAPQRPHRKLWHWAALLAASAALMGCVVTPIEASGHYRHDTVIYTHYGYPPPLRLERRPPVPGPDYTWQQGQWVWNGQRYHWHSGRWLHTRPARPAPPHLAPHRPGVRPHTPPAHIAPKPPPHQPQTRPQARPPAKPQARPPAPHRPNAPQIKPQAGPQKPAPQRPGPNRARPAPEHPHPDAHPQRPGGWQR